MKIINYLLLHVFLDNKNIHKHTYGVLWSFHHSIGNDVIKYVFFKCHKHKGL